MKIKDETNNVGAGPVSAPKGKAQGISHSYAPKMLRLA